MKKLRTVDRHNDAYLHGFHDALTNKSASEGLLVYGRREEVTIYRLGYVDGLLELKRRSQSGDDDCRSAATCEHAGAEDALKNLK